MSDGQPLNCRIRKPEVLKQPNELCDRGNHRNESEILRPKQSCQDCSRDQVERKPCALSGQSYGSSAKGSRVQILLQVIRPEVLFVSSRLASIPQYR